MRFEQAIIVVTGASTGLGRAVAQQCAAEGARAVVVNYASNRAEADHTAALVRDQGAEPLIVQGDVAVDEDCRRIAASAAPYGRIDAVFNNAGITRFARDHSDLSALSSDDFQRVYAVNVVGAFQMIRAARALLENGPTAGAVVNTSSIAGVTGIGSSVAYAASKGALNTLTLSLARALAPRIRVNAICPGFIDTDWFAREFGADELDRLRAQSVARSPLQVASRPEDVAATALFLASQDARHVTGETLLVDAGAHLGYAPLKAR